MRALLPCQGLTASEVRLLAELGQTIALSFSELGYTVFTLHPTQQQESHAEPSQQAADTSSATVCLSLLPPQIAGWLIMCRVPSVSSCTLGTRRRRGLVTLGGWLPQLHSI